MKPTIPIHLAVEDDLSEWLLRRLLKGRSVAYAEGTIFKRNGFGFLKKNAVAFNNMARVCPVLLLTDLDRRPCPPDLIKEWLQPPRHKDFLLRVAVREVEAWVLATDASLGGFLGIRRRIAFPTPEGLSDPKLELLKLASDSPRRDLRDALVRREGDGNLRQGPAYNSTLASFIRDEWQPAVAAEKCPSLSRLLNALTALEADWAGRRQ